MPLKSNTCLINIGEGDAIGKYFTVANAGPAFDGLDVKLTSLTRDGLAEISVVRKNGLMVGDKPLQMPVVPGTFFLAKKVLFLSAYQDEIEFATTNDFGKYVAEGSLQRENVKVVYVEYSNALSVNVYDTGVTPSKVLYSRVFLGALTADDALFVIENDFKTADDPALIVNLLKEIK